MQKINIAQKFDTFSEHWSPKIVAELNGQHVKIARLLGEFDWHFHQHEDELFWVIDGTLEIQLRDRTFEINAGEMFVVPAGVEHKPVARQEVQLVLFEPAATRNTGNVQNEMTLNELDRI